MVSRRRRRRYRTAGWVPGALLVAGAAIVMALIWAGATPRVDATWTGQRWTSDAYDRELITYDMAFAGLGALAGILSAAYLVVKADHDHAIRRTVSVLGSAAAGSVIMWGLGIVFGHSQTPARGGTAAGPLVLSSPILLVVWPAVAALIAALALALLQLRPHRRRVATTANPSSQDETSAGQRGRAHKLAE